jgi:ubiquinone/menaquinone biosynthesis C-methylase UbiE
MNDYRIIFQKRADDYHFAMQEYPNVRKDEFQNLISNTNFAKITEVLDIPSGGGYLKNYIPKHVNVTFTDFSEGFTNETVKLVKPEKLPFSSESFDIVYSLSGMHHLNNVTLFIEECLRVIRADGDFIFADVKKGTSVDEFLNEFVNKYNSLGHTGDFLSHDYFENQPLYSIFF